MRVNKERALARLKALEHDYKRYSDPAVMLAFKASILDDVWGVYGGGIIDPAHSAFAVGRIFQAMQPYATALMVIAEYEQLEKSLAEVAMIEDKESI